MMPSAPVTLTDPSPGSEACAARSIAFHSSAGAPAPDTLSVDDQLAEGGVNERKTPAHILRDDHRPVLRLGRGRLQREAPAPLEVREHEPRHGDEQSRGEEEDK